jgi:predicted NBD/HSP70 family sugar kinase
VKYHWEELPLRKILNEYFKVPVYIANDSHVAALAEYHFGQKTEEQSLVLLKVSDGISAGLILRGKIHYGDGFGAGEIGHICVEPHGLPCRCGHSGCLETVSSQRAVVQMAREVLHENPETGDSEILKRLLAETRAGNPDCRKVVQKAGEYLGLAAANIIGLLNVHQIVLAGTLSCLGDDLLSPMIEASRDKALDALSRQTHIFISNLGDEIVQLGAAALVQQEILGIF